MRIFVFAALLFLVPRLSIGQSGGENVYDFLNMTHSARLAALGGAQVGLADNDATVDITIETIDDDFGTDTRQEVAAPVGSR